MMDLGVGEAASPAFIVTDAVTPATHADRLVMSGQKTMQTVSFKDLN